MNDELRHANNYKYIKREWKNGKWQYTYKDDETNRKNGLVSTLMNNELYHYGVLGMKWGVRRNASKAYARASKKANKLEKKSVERNLKAAELRSKALKKSAKATSEKQYQKARQIEFEANKQQLKAAKLVKKKAKWEKKMTREFAQIKISDISSEHLEKGKKYTYMLLKNAA